MAEVQGGGAIVEVLRAYGVTHFFNVPGESFLPVLDAVGSEPSIELVTNRHESGASFAADGFAKLSGRPAVCMATRGPGATNLSIGIHTAHYDATPMVAMLGLIPRAMQGSHAFQEFDPLSMFASLAKRTMVVADRATLAQTVAQALTEAASGRPGPVVVGIPTDVLSATAPPAQFAPMAIAAEPSVDLEPLVDLLRQASAPAFLMSTGAVRGACATDVGTIATHLGAPVVCGWRRFSAFDNDHPCFAGSLGLGGDASVVSTLDASDLVIAFGAIEQVTVDSAHLNRPGLTVALVAAIPDPDLSRRLPLARLVPILADPAGVARRLAEEVTSLPSSGRQAPLIRADADQTAGDFTADSAMTRLNEWAPPNAVVVSDAGDFAQALLRRLRFGAERSFIGPLNGSMGYGLPAAIGAQLADRARPVFCIAGDGGLLMTAGEMETAARLGLEITVVVFNNQAYGTIRTRQAEAFPGREYGTSLGPVSFTQLATGMGWRSWSASGPAELDAALSHAEDARGCRLVEVCLEG